MSEDCGCCTTPPAAIPAEIKNRPGLSAIASRIGTFATFRKSILDELSHIPELANLAARISNDYTITVVDLWSAVADVLTFYHERCANEAFIRTATLRDSVLRLVRIIDYQLRPGAAATSLLAFTLDSGATALIPSGTRVQSIPGEGEKPQKYETLAPLLGDARLNRLRIFPKPVATIPLRQGSTGAFAAPDEAALAAAASLTPGDRVMLYAAKPANPAKVIEILTVRDVSSRDDLLSVNFATPVSADSFNTAHHAENPLCRAYKLGRTFHLFGIDAPVRVVVADQTDPTDATTSYLATAVSDFTLHGDGTSGNQLSLDGRYPGIKPGAVVLAAGIFAGQPTAIPFQVDAVREKSVSRNATVKLSTKTVTVISQSGTVAQLDLTPLGSLSLANLQSPDDIRDIVIHELIGPPLRFWPFAYADLVASDDIYLPGRRSGWSAVEVGCTIEKGVVKPGVEIDAHDLPVGRRVLLQDAKGGSPVAATIAAVSIVDTGVSVGPTDSDATTIRTLHLADDQAIQTTVMVSASLGTSVPLSGQRHELSVTIGSLPPQTITINPITAGGTIAGTAAALQAAIRAAQPGVPTFAHAQAWPVFDPVVFAPGQGAIVVAPGVAGDRIAFDAAPNDPTTVIELGLDAARVRLLDGVVSAPVEPSFSQWAIGFVRVASGTDAGIDRFLFASITSAGTLMAAIAVWFGLITQVTDDQRVIVLPRIPKYRQRAFLRLSLNRETSIGLDGTTAVLLGNVTPASHGETIRQEILGDGDASQTFQRFVLKKKPVTYVPSAVPGGVMSSLAVLVNGVRWNEVPSLYGASPLDQSFITRIADDGALTVQFGDGVTGQRTVSGRQNVVAQYRQGIGLGGRVGPGKLSNLLDRPTGVRNVTNPMAADGGADPETIDRARQAAPGTVRTFGRAISLRDFEDTALMAGEVAKVSATWVWTGERRVIHLTIAAQGGAIFSSDGLKRLAATLAAERDPNHRLLMDNYSPVAVLVSASIIVDDRYIASDVLAAARAALMDSLSFDQRAFAQPVYLSDVFAVLQNVAGVVAVDVDTLDLKSRDPGFRAAHGVDDALGQPQPRLLMLPARPAAPSGIILPAELASVEVPMQDVVLRSTGGMS